jgi:uncharacterized protein
LPSALAVRTPNDQAAVKRLLAELDPGESEAIVLARELPADWLFIDEKVGRQVARREGLAILGLGGVCFELNDLV